MNDRRLDEQPLRSSNRRNEPNRRDDRLDERHSSALAFSVAKASDVAIDEQLDELSATDALLLPERLLDAPEDEALVRERGMAVIDDLARASETQ